jgi:hypothetical protein
MVTSRRALDATLVLDNPATRGAHFLYERDPMPTCSHVAQFSSAQVLCVVHTKGATSVPGCAQLFPAQGVMGDGWNRAKSTARLPFDVRRTSTVRGCSKNHDATEQHSMQRVFFSCLLTGSALPRLSRQAGPHPTSSRPLMPRLAPLRLSFRAQPLCKNTCRTGLTTEPKRRKCKEHDVRRAWAKATTVP